MQIAIVGGGPAALFVFKKITEEYARNLEVSIFEATDSVGPGMPYSAAGAGPEHITNVSGIEVPGLYDSVTEWIKRLSPEQLETFGVERNISEYKVLPRLLFGRYLEDQFTGYIEKAELGGASIRIFKRTIVTDIIDDGESNRVTLLTEDGETFDFDSVVICTGHVWPHDRDRMRLGVFGSPYPPDKLKGVRGRHVAVRGASLTAIDAVKTIARANGHFTKEEGVDMRFVPHSDCLDFKVVLHSREGFLPAVRYHSESAIGSRPSLLSREALDEHRRRNDGFISLDYLFENDFKLRCKEKDEGFYDFIRTMSMEEFVEAMLAERDRSDPFEYFKQEYFEASRSIAREEPIVWKDQLADLSRTMNYPAKYFSAEDRLRLQKTLMPLISLVIASIPQRSCEELFALREAGKIELVKVEAGSDVVVREGGGVDYFYSSNVAPVYFPFFVDCVGQKPIEFEDFPFESLVQSGSVTPARLRFASQEAARNAMQNSDNVVERGSEGNKLLRVPGIAINDYFQAVNQHGKASERIFVMAVPLIAGYNPDYSGLDFCEAASAQIVKAIAPN